MIRLIHVLLVAILESLETKGLWAELSNGKSEASHFSESVCPNGSFKFQTVQKLIRLSLKRVLRLYVASCSTVHLFKYHSFFCVIKHSTMSPTSVFFLPKISLYCKQM